MKFDKSMASAMLDIETLGTKPGCVVLEIALLVFRPAGADFGELPEEAWPRMQLFPTLPDQVAAGLTIDPDTVLWWLARSDEARREVYSQEGRETVDWLRIPDFLELYKIGEVWAFGSSFDFPVLHAFCKATEIIYPFPYRSERDARTILRMAGIDRTDFTRPFDVTHSALSDCFVQSRALLKAFEQISFKEDQNNV